MTESETNAVPEGIDPDESPFERPAVEGIPYKRNSEEDRAIRKVIEEADKARGRTTSA